MAPSCRSGLARRVHDDHIRSVSRRSQAFAAELLRTLRILPVEGLHVPGQGGDERITLGPPRHDGLAHAGPAPSNHGNHANRARPACGYAEVRAKPVTT